MTSINTCVLSGNLTRDPELRQCPSGTKVASSTIAVNHTWKNRAGERQEEAAFIEFRVFGLVAEVISKHLRKGSAVILHGRLSQERWTDTSGEQRHKVVMVADRFQCLLPRSARDEYAPQVEAPVTQNQQA